MKNGLRKVLVANRGEIAVRVIRALRERGIVSVAVYSEADRDGLATQMADEAHCIGPAPSIKSYLRAPEIVDLAFRVGADAIHPGYGFLSENADFARRCEERGVTFIGPSSEAIAAMGSKIESRRLMRAAGVPIVPGGTEPLADAEAARAAAREIGYPVMLKASAGGGGKGMVTVTGEDALEEGIARARREALATAGDGTLYVERRIERPRHVEVQVMADRHGNVLQLGERDCSTQRRHQKVVEETPAPGLSDGLRARLAAAAVDVSRHAGYENAGTVEFLVDGTGDDAGCYFLEMNTRLQVEHPITELVTGVDLVEAQLAVAAGRRLPWTTGDVGPRGYAIECRVYAEDPAVDYLPQAGTITGYHEPAGPGIRVDSGVGRGSDVPVHYDPLLAKLAAAGRTREQARQRAHAALGELAVLGLRTNIGLLRRVLAHDAFVAGDVHTGFLAEHERVLIEAPPDEVIVAAAVAAVSATLAKRDRRTAAGDRSSSGAPPRGDTVSYEGNDGVWNRLAGWRLGVTDD